MQPPPLPGDALDVHLKPAGCTDTLVAVITLGLYPLYFYFYKQKMPRRLTREGMILRNGKQIPWGQFTRVKRTDIFYGPREVFTGSRYQLWHSRGKVQFGTPMLANADDVVAFMAQHLPPEARGAPA
jgi:hypothetical protein